MGNYRATMNTNILVLVVVLSIAFEATFAVKYTADQTYKKVHERCCGTKKRAESSTFLAKKSVAKRGLYEECCNEGCSYEEVFETPYLLEECTQEGCSYEEIEEALSCPYTWNPFC